MELDNSCKDKFHVMTFSPPAPIPKEEEIETPIILLTYFGTAVHVCFDKVKVGSTKLRQIVIKNPNEISLEVMVKKFPYAKGFSVNVQKFNLESEEEKSLDITWSPTEDGCFREIVLLQANNGCQKQIILLGTAITPQKKKKQMSKRINTKLSTNYKAQNIKLFSTFKKKKDIKENKVIQISADGDSMKNSSVKYIVLNSENCENDSNGINVDDAAGRAFAHQDAEHPLPPTPLRRQTYILENNVCEKRTESSEENTMKTPLNTHTPHRKKYHKKTGLKQKYRTPPLQRNFYLKNTLNNSETRRETFVKQPLFQLEDSLECETNDFLDDSLNMLTKSNTKHNIDEYNNLITKNEVCLIDKLVPNQQNSEICISKKNRKIALNYLYEDNIKEITEVHVDNMKNMYIQDGIIGNHKSPIETKPHEQDSVIQENDFYDSINESLEKENSFSEKLQLQTENMGIPSRLSSETVVITQPLISSAVLPHCSSSEQSKTCTKILPNENIMCPQIQTRERELVPISFGSLNLTLADSATEFSFLNSKSSENKYCSTGITSKLPPLTIMSDHLSSGNQFSFHEFNNNSNSCNENNSVSSKMENLHFVDDDCRNEGKAATNMIEKLTFDEDTCTENIQDEQQKQMSHAFTISPVLSKKKLLKQNSGLMNYTNKLTNTRSIKKTKPFSNKNSKAENGPKKENINEELKSKIHLKKKFKIAQSKLTLIKPVNIGISTIRHPNPFAAKNMYYDEKWMLKQEFGFTRWLNFVLTPPEDLTVDDIKVDAVKLWQDNLCNAAANPAPTKEQLSFKAYTALRQLNRLRHSACLMYQSQPVVFVITRLETEIENNKLIVRKDKALHADIGIKKYILKLLMDYNPLWLRIGLETVFGELIHLHSNSDVLGLSRFIIHRLLNNPDISSKYAHPKVPHLFKPGYEEELKKFTLKKFLLLVYFLDNAKLTRLIDHDPCLFCKNAKYKSSRDLLLAFSREFLSGEGDITRHLRYLGYSVSHVQTALEEFEYAVTNLAVDLRCGLRLARVIELIFKQWSLSKKLRVPAISRLQKIHNVEVSLEALKLSGFVLLGDINARDIVDGHREKTLSLLWQLVFKSQVEIILNKEKLKEEIIFLCKNFKVCHKLASIREYNDIISSIVNIPESSKNSKLYSESEVLQLLLQWCQSVCVYYNLKIENFTVSFCDGRALCYLIHHYHPCLLLVEEIKQNTTQTFWAEESNALDSFEIASCTYDNNKSKNDSIEELLNNERSNIKLAFDKIQELGGIPITSQPNYICNTIPDEKVMIVLIAYLNCRLMDLSEEIRAARIIQLAWRRMKLQKQIKQRELENKAATIIQSCFRKFLAKQKIKKQEKSAVIIQKCWRRLKAIQFVNKLRSEKIKQQQDKMATLIQKTFRGYLTRKTFHRKRNAVILLQTNIRCFLARKKYKKKYKAILVIQDHFRSMHLAKIERERYLRTKKSIILIQSHAKRIIEQRKYRILYQSVIILQSYIRMVIVRSNYLKTRNTIIKIQQRYRAILLGRLTREEYLKAKNAAVKIQNWFRAVVIRTTYLKKKQAALIIQKNVRKHIAQTKFKQIKACVINIQRRWRATLLMRKERNQYLDFKNKVILLQSLLRKWLQQRKWKQIRKAAITLQATFKGWKTRTHYERIKWATIVSQRKWRALQLGKKERENYMKIYKAAIIIQTSFRTYIARKKFLQQKAAIVKIQSYVRMFLVQKHLLSLKFSVATIEKIRIAQICGRKQREEFIKMKHSAIIIQSYYRCYYHRKCYLKKKNSIIILQSLIRGWLERCKLKKMHAAATCIQKYYKSVLVMRYYREEFHKLKKATIFIQSQFRSKKMRKIYITKKCAAITIQRRFRAKLLATKIREEYIKTKSAAIIIQSVYRGFICRKQFRKLKAVLIIQSHIRKYLVQKKYRKLQTSVIKIQSLIRMHQQRTRYLKLYKAVVLLQQVFRARKKTQEIRQQFLLLRAYSIKMQTWTRMKIQRKQYLLQKMSAIKIQAAWRRYIYRKSISRMNKAAAVIQINYRAYLEGKKQREKYLKIKKSIIILQAWSRMTIIRCHFLKQQKACILIQAYVRAYLQRKKFRQLKSSTLVIQQRFRAYYYGKQVYNEYKMMRHSTIKIQSVIRGFIARRKFLQCQKAAIKIQAWYKSKKTAREYRRIISAAVVIQKHFRAYLLMKQLRFEYIQKKEAVKIIEKAYCSYKERKSIYLTSVIKIQSLIRMYLVQKKFSKMRRACLKLQAIYRMKQERKKYLKLKNATVTLQRYFKATIKRNNSIKQYSLIRKSCIIIQSWWRGCLVRKQQHKRENSIRIIQRNFRALRVRKQYLNLKKATIIIQRKWRTILAQRAIKAEFKKQWEAATIIQKFYVKYNIVKEIKTLYSTCVLTPRVSFFLLETYYSRSRAAVKIQSWYRMITCKRIYNYMRHFSLKSFVKMYIMASTSYSEILLYKNLNAVIIQSWYRKHYQKQRYLNTRKNIIKIQSLYRGYRERCKYLKICKAVIILQQRWKLYVVKQKKLKQMEAAASTIQVWYRRTKIKRELAKQKQELLNEALKKCTLMNNTVFQMNGNYSDALLQSSYNCYVIINDIQLSEAKRHIQLHKFVCSAYANKCAICIQRYYRHFQYRKSIEEKTKAVLIIQHFFRCKLIRIRYLKFRQSLINFQRSARKYLKIRYHAAFTIQNAVRSWLKRKYHLKLHKSAVIIQATWRGYKIRRNITNKKIINARERVKAATVNATDDMKLVNRTNYALYILLGQHSLTHILSTLINLDKTSQLSPICCEKMTEGRALDVLMHILHNCNRSVPHMELIKYTINIFLNLAKYAKTVNVVWNTEGMLETILELMKIYREKGTGIFTKLCTLVWILCHDPEKAKVIKENKQIVEKFHSFHYLLIRKQTFNKVQQKSKNKGPLVPLAFSLSNNPNGSQLLPRISPQWTSSKNHLKEFEDPLIAILAIMKLIGIRRREYKQLGNTSIQLF